MTTPRSFHQSRHERRMRESAEYRTAYEQSSREVAQIDELMQHLDAARVRLGMSKADLAREIGKNPQVVRRLFSAETRNPELKTVAAIASALGGRVRVDFPDAVGH
jgi:ribosome-binding protein aMBF1 (putative translation factor)